ncbi:cytochrome c oxidase subunit II [Orrella daihaiensis]|uniref:Cytochrome c oxidase subunit 2 n=1 Tax=Orrella daihaiensis TaxID=2782176 RepID=A0ABY4ARC4_9BURK|nr:cytochrome c oxidase subunit II [Orrella daihaiensis]UOD50599.1 cytochrome c oxidase subunit II [Orrella daihaiensis]
MMKFKGLVAACALTMSGVAAAQVDMPGGPAVNQLNLTTGVTQIARDVAWLHWMMLIICLVIFVGVFGVMFYSIWAHRKSKGAKPATFHESVGVEIAWTVIPFLIVIGMALPATRTVVAMKDTSGADMTVKVTGYQWKWGYEYMDGPAEGVSFLSNLTTPPAQINNLEPKGEFYLMEVDNPLVVPVGQKVRVVVTAGDVIHSWMVPDLGVKQDAIPGFLRDTWFRAEQVGEYRGQCAELCGKDHAFMPIVVKVVSQEDYVAWAQQQQAALTASADDPNKEWAVEELVARGQSVYTSQCVACHQATGKGVAPVFPALDGSQIVMGPMAGHIEIMLKGKQGTAMQSYANLSDVELASVITYARQSWGNAGKGTDPVVQPAQVRDAR